MTAGRPLRFLAAMVGGWIVLRGIAVWPTQVDMVRTIAPISGGRAQAAVRGTAPPVRAIVSDRSPVRWPRVAPPPLAVATGPRGTAVAAPSAPIITELVIATDPPRPPIPPPAIPPPLVRAPIAPASIGESRWRVSAWAIARGGERGAPLGGQLGGSQAGVRATYTLLPDRRIALAARVATPLRGRGREIGVGIDWQPTRAPIHLIAEQRVGIDGGRGGPTIELVGGFGPVAVLPGVSAEGYAQAGGILRDGIEGFADGAARVTHPVVQAGRVRADIGIGSWGGAQRGAARVDIGPSAGLVVPVGASAVRVTLDWRQRIAGDAAPGSGPALSIGSDF